MTSPSTAAPEIPVDEACPEWVEGTVHPTGGYDRISYYEEQLAESVSYRLHRLSHREDGPAEILTETDGSRRESYYRHGELFRAEGPSDAYYRADGSLEAESYAFGGGSLHRIDGPARIFHLENSVEKLEEWFLDGARHRLDGPAVVMPPGFDREWARNFLPAVPVETEGYRYEWWVHGVNLAYAEHIRLSEALAFDAPLEWALAYARGEVS